jgi:zinc transporter 1/2/3
LTAQLLTCDVELAAALAPPSGAACEPGEQETFGVPLHVGGIFAILAFSLLGALMPLLGKFWPRCALPGLAIALGKAAGTGIILACALVHMLLPANAALTSACLSAALTEDYAAYAYLFCLLAALIMHNLELLLADAFSGAPPPVAAAAAAAPQLDDAKGAAGAAVGDKARAASAAAAAAALGEEEPQQPKQLGASAGDCEDCRSAEEGEEGCAASPPAAAAAAAAVTAKTSSLSAIAASNSEPLLHSHAHGHAHSHGAGLATAASPLLAAIMLEVAMTVHSVIIGLAVGLAADDDYVPLLVALVFHQFFEGIALGARLFETDFSNCFNVLLALLFALSCPIGMAVGTGLIAAGGIATNSVAFLVTTGVLDGVCAGILLYIGFSLLLGDFAADVKKYAAHDGARKAALFAALWLGAGAMAFIGRYL